METLSGILASFDVFKVIVNSFPQAFKPLVHAFQVIFVTLSDLALEQFRAHPGLISGTIIFLALYAGWQGITALRKKALPVRSA